MWIGYVLLITSILTNIYLHLSSNNVKEEYKPLNKLQRAYLIFENENVLTEKGKKYKNLGFIWGYGSFIIIIAHIIYIYAI